MVRRGQGSRLERAKLNIHEHYISIYLGGPFSLFSLLSSRCYMFVCLYHDGRHPFRDATHFTFFRLTIVSRVFWPLFPALVFSLFVA